MKSLLALMAVAMAILGYYYLHRPITYPAGVLIESEPDQVMIPNEEPAIPYRDYTLKPLAHFSLDARILHRKNYGYDRSAKLVPVDLAVGWGPMSDQAVLDKMEITQSMHFYWYQYQSPPIPKEEIISHST